MEINTETLMNQMTELVITYGPKLLGALIVWIIGSMIVKWMSNTFSKLLEKNKIGISCNPEDWLNSALNMHKFRLVALSPSIAYRSTVLPQTFHNDPGDQIIVATAREENAIILTKDKRIQDYNHVKSLW